MKEIALTKGAVALVDEVDYESLSQHSWCLWGKYAARYVYSNGRRRRITMHSAILSVPDGFQVDHRNRNKLDNRRENLRPATGSQNQANRDCRSRLSGFHGVTADRGRWKAHIQVGGRHYNLGRFNSAADAARRRDAAAAFYFGDFAHLNFPDELPEPVPFVTSPNQRLESLKRPETCEFCGKQFALAGIAMHRRACGGNEGRQAA
jgi:hypothetical protein